jgi:hypothetical protein
MMDPARDNQARRDARVRQFANKRDEDREHATTRRRGSDRNFGFVFAVLFVFFGLSPLRHGGPVRPLFLLSSGILVGLALARPSLLRIPNLLWTRLGVVLGKVVNPVVSTLLFYLVFTPFAVVLRWKGRDYLGLSLDREARTYWVPRSPERSSGMTSQF